MRMSSDRHYPIQQHHSQRMFYVGENAKYELEEGSQGGHLELFQSFKMMVALDVVSEMTDLRHISGAR